MAITDPIDDSLLMKAFTNMCRDNLRAELEATLKPVYDQLLQTSIDNAMKDLEVHLRAHFDHLNNRMSVQVVAGPRKEK